MRLRLEARLVGAEAAAERRPAVHLLDQPGGGQHVEIAAHRHLRDAEQLGQLADAHGALAADLLDDQLLALVASMAPSRSIEQDSTLSCNFVKSNQPTISLTCYRILGRLDTSAPNMPVLAVDQ